jgi:hypothetical protein
MQKISDENAKITAAIKSACRIKLAGLERRVHWLRTDIAQLTLFIPYTAEVTDCGNGANASAEK